jgi:hypothetical protein
MKVVIRTFFFRYRDYSRTFVMKDRMCAHAWLCFFNDLVLVTFLLSLQHSLITVVNDQEKDSRITTRDTDNDEKKHRRNFYQNSHEFTFSCFKATCGLFHVILGTFRTSVWFVVLLCRVSGHFLSKRQPDYSFRKWVCLNIREIR